MLSYNSVSGTFPSPYVKLKIVWFLQNGLKRSFLAILKEPDDGTSNYLKRH